MTLDARTSTGASTETVAAPRRGTEAEFSAQPLRPVAHWVVLPEDTGSHRLTCVWEVPNPQVPR